VPSLWVGTESTSEELALWYISIYRKETQRRSTKLCRLSGVFWNERRCYGQVTWCGESSGCRQCVKYGRKRESRCRQEEGIYILKFRGFLGWTCEIWYCWFISCVLLVNEQKMAQLSLAQPPGTSWTTSLEMRFSTQGEDSLHHRALLLHHIPHLPLRPRASQSKQSSSQVIPTVQPSNTATNRPSGGTSTCNCDHKLENTS